MTFWKTVSAVLVAQLISMLVTFLLYGMLLLVILPKY